MNTSSLAAPACQPAFTEREFRNALGQFATGVTVVTALDAQGSPCGMTVSSFNAVSLNPALVLWSLGHAAGNYPVFAHAPHYVIHVLASTQKDVALQFSQRGTDRFAGIAWQPNAHGVPVLQDSLATFECRARSQYPEGDHLILVGEVQAVRHTSGAAPLLYHGGHLR